eukprot:gene3672-13747_t
MQPSSFPYFRQILAFERLNNSGAAVPSSRYVFEAPESETHQNAPYLSLKERQKNAGTVTTVKPFDKFPFLIKYEDGDKEWSDLKELKYEDGDKEWSDLKELKYEDRDKEWSDVMELKEPKDPFPFLIKYEDGDKEWSDLMEC